MLVWEDGPFELLFKFRAWLNVEEPEKNEGAKYTLSLLFGCIYCCSFWTALFFTVLYLISVKWSAIIALPFALSSFAFVMERIRD